MSTILDLLILRQQVVFYPVRGWKSLEGGEGDAETESCEGVRGRLVSRQHGAGSDPPRPDKVYYVTYRISARRKSAMRRSAEIRIGWGG